MNGEGKLEVRHWDKNSNEFLSDATKEETALQPAGADGVKEQIEKLNLQRTKNNSPKVMHTVLNTGNAINTPSGMITTLHLSAGSLERSPPRKSPAYCFHSFTYGVGGSRENTANENGIAAQKEESFDADSPDVWHTRTVVDPEESGSPSIQLKWSSEIKENGLSKNLESCKEDRNGGKTYLYSLAEQDEMETSGESCDKLETEKFVRRLSPEGAENTAMNTQVKTDEEITEDYLMVPSERIVCAEQQRDTLGSNSLACSPSGRIYDDKAYWALEDTIDGKEVVDTNCNDRAPLIHPGKPGKRYIPEKAFEETYERVPIPCFPCGRCVVL